MTLYTFLAPLDLFKEPLFLRVSQNEKLSTKFGLFISILIYTFLIYSFFQNDYFKRQKPSIIVQTSTLIHRPRINYQSKAFAFSIKDIQGNTYSDPRFFYFVAQSYQTKTLSNGSITVEISEKAFHLCNESDANGPEEWLFIQNSYCLDLDQDTNGFFELEGGIGEENMKNFQINVFWCQNTTENPTICKTPEEIDAFFNFKNLNLVFSNIVFDPSNYESPSFTKTFSMMNKVDSQLSTLVTMNFQKVRLTTDETKFYTSETNMLETYVYESEKLESGRLSSNLQPIATILLFSSDNVLFISRSYQKLSEALANLGGLLSFLLVCGRILSKVDKSLYMTTLLMNFLYSFQQPTNPFSSEKSPSPVKKLSNSVTFFNKKKDLEINGSNDRNLPKVSSLENMNLNYGFESTHHNDKSNFSNLIKGAEIGSTNNLLSTEMNVISEFGKCQKFKIDFDKLEKKILNDEDAHFSLQSTPKKRFSDNTWSTPNNRPKMWKSARDKIVIAPYRMIRKSFFGADFFEERNEKEKKTLEEFLKFRDHKNKIKFSTCEYIKYSLKKMCRMAFNFKEKLFIKAQDTFENEIDIVNILHRIQDIEKLKYLLLNENQMALFNVLEKPMIYVDENKNPNRTSFSLVFTPKKISGKLQVQKAFDYYQELQQGREMDTIDRKLFFLVDKKFKTFQKYFKTEN